MLLVPIVVDGVVQFVVTSAPALAVGGVLSTVTTTVSLALQPLILLVVVTI